ncbi:MAG: FHA domain-containing protein [Planctomycetota bacterium]
MSMSPPSHGFELGTPIVPVPGEGSEALAVQGQPGGAGDVLSWCERRLVVRVQSVHGARTLDLQQPFAVVGSDPAADIQLADDAVARRRWYLHAVDEGLFAIDLTTTDGRSDAVGRWVGPEEELEVGPFRLTVQLTPTPAGPPPRHKLTARERAIASRPLMEVARDGETLITRHWSRRLALAGTAPVCRIRFDSRSVSAVHCALYWDDQRLWVIDLVSDQGTVCHGERRRVAALSLGDACGIGNYTLCLQRESEMAAAPAVAERSFDRWREEAAALATARADWERKSAELTVLRAKLEVEFNESVVARRHWQEAAAELAQAREQLEQAHEQLEQERGQLGQAREQLGQAREQLEQERSEQSVALAMPLARPMQISLPVTLPVGATDGITESLFRREVPASELAARTTITEEDERLTSHLLNLTADDRRRKKVWALIGLVLFATVIASSVAAIWLNREQLVKKNSWIYRSLGDSGEP